MGRGRVAPPIKDGDWGSVRRAIARLSTIVLGSEAEPVYTGLTLTGLTLDKLIGSSSGKLQSEDLTSWIAGTTNQIAVADDGDGSVTLSTPQDIHTGASPTFDGGEFTSVVTGIFPTAGVHLATKEYVDLAIGASFDLFLSDTDDGVVADTHVMYQMETDEVQSTEDSPSLSDGPDQLALSWLSEAGVPGTSTMREGVYDCHVHLNKNSGGATTTVYWKLSYVDANGTSGKILICKSETSGAITTSEIGYDLHATVADEIPLGATKRLLFEIYANISVGQNVTLTATLEGANDSHISFMLPSSIWQSQGNVLDDLNILGAVGSDSEFLVGTGAGVLAWEKNATVRTSLGLGASDSVAFGTLASGSITTTGQFLAPRGTTFPVYSFVNDITTGMFINPSDVLTLGVDDAGVLFIETAGISLVANANITLSGTSHITPGSGGVILGDTTILDGEIINAAELIAFVDSSGGSNISVTMGILGVGITASEFIIDPEGFRSHDSGTWNDVYRAHTGQGFDNIYRHFNGAAGINTTYYRARGASRATYNFLDDDDYIKQFMFKGAVGNTTDWSLVLARMVVRADGDHNIGDYRTRFEWETTLPNATSDSLAMTLDSIGDLILDRGEFIGHGATLGDGTNEVQVSATGDLSFKGTAGFYPRRIKQDAEPANGIGATQIDVGEVMVWVDDDDADKIHFVYNDTDTGIKNIELGGAIIDDLNALGAPASVGQFIVATGAGAFAYEKDATVRTSLGVGIGDAPTFTTLTLSSIAAENIDVNKFLVDSSGIIKFRTGVEVLSDIGASASGHNHSGTYQPLDAELTSLAGLSYAAASFVKMTGANTFALRTLGEVLSDLSLDNVSNVATDDTTYNATSWNTNTDAATKNAIRDKIEMMDTAIDSNTAYRGLYDTSETAIYSGTPTANTWADIDMSSHIASITSRHLLCILVRRTANDTNTDIVIAPKSLAKYSKPATTIYPVGMNIGHYQTNASDVLLWVVTDDDGDISWKVSSTNAIAIYVLAYILLSPD